MTTPTQTKPSTKATVADHLRETLKGDIAAHLVAAHGLDAATLPTNKQQLAKIHADQPEPHTHSSSNGQSKATPVRSSAGTGRVASSERKAALAAAKTVPTKSAQAAPAATPATSETPEQTIARLQAELAKAQATPTKTAPAKAAPAAKDTRFSDARAELGLLVVRTLDAMVGSLPKSVLEGMTQAEAAKMVSQWIHHMPTGRDAAGKRVWPAANMPKPDRSDWR